MKPFLLEQQLHDTETATKLASESLEAHENTNQALNNPQIEKACACPHLAEFLPSELDLEFVKTTKRGFVLANPIHALHLQSQLDPNWLKTLQEAPTLYGHEQERTQAVTTSGIAETWHPWLRDQSTIDMNKYQKESAMLPSEHSFQPPSLRTIASSNALRPTTNQTASLSSRMDTQSLKSETSAAVVGPLQPPGALHPAIPTSAVSMPVTAFLQAQRAKGPTGKLPKLKRESSNTAATGVPVNSILSASSRAIVNPTQTTASASNLGAPKTIVSSMTAARPKSASWPPTEALLTNEQFATLYRQEQQISFARQLLFSKRSAASKNRPTASSATAKRQKTEHNDSSLSSKKPISNRQNDSNFNILTPEEEREYDSRVYQARTQVEVWLEHYRLSRQAYWQEQRLPRKRPPEQKVFGAIDTELTSQVRFCQLCRSNDYQDEWSYTTEMNEECSGDDLMQCLECTFVGCAPCSALPSSRHILQHMLLSNHKFAVTCGRQARVYCFKCGDFVYHEVFEQEKERLDLVEKLPWQAWKEHPVQRSFDALQFMRIRDHGIFWRGMVARYPQMVPSEHVRVARLCRLRQILFQGEIEDLPLEASSTAKEFAALQACKKPSERWRISAPIGMFNLGNTCYQSSVLQCLINCIPVQKYFLQHIGHYHESCEAYRKAKSTKSPSRNGDKMGPSNNTTKTKAHAVCIACELDKLILRYYGSTVAIDVASVIANVSENELTERSKGLDVKPGVVREITRGDPLVTTEMLTAVWKTKGMNHLAGYEQRDAHEFLHAFLENLGKQIRQYRERMYKMINTANPGNAIITVDKRSDHDVIKTLFEGTLRSVLVCQKCGSKRTQSEPFMSISLPLSEEVQKATIQMPGDSSSPTRRLNLSVERCLRHFTLPESLTDPVDCPSCGKKTPTKKQHVVSKLPKVLCLHLKRFDAAQSRKIEDYVSFPAKLNMGPFLPHWCEITRVPESDSTCIDAPRVMYNLFGTVNHFGTINSGHYVANVKVDGQWFHCNDALVTNAGVGDGEVEVLRSNAYMLYYIRAT